MKAMKLMLVITTIIGVLSITSGCPAPSSFSGVRNPNVITDGLGDVFVVYQVNENDTQTTYIQKLETDGEFQWSGKGMTLYSEQGPSEGGGTSALLVNGDNRSIILVWEQADSIWAQKIDYEGRFLWSAGNVRIASGTYGLKVAGDSSGGVVMAWSDDNSTLNIQRLDSQGDIVWKTDAFADEVQSFDIFIDGSGSTLIVWEDRDFNVMLQKLDSTGMVSWTTGGILVSETHGPGVGLSRITSDGADGAIVAWISGTRSEDTPGIIGQEVFAQRINRDGNIVWQTGGIPVCTSAQGNRTIFAIEPRMVGDTAGGVIILWREMLSIYAQKIDTSGNVLWINNGQQVWNGTGAQGDTSSSIISDNHGGVIIVWCYTPAGKNIDTDMLISAQRVANNGQKLWDDDGIPLSEEFPNYLFLPQISLDSQGATIAVWTAGKSIHNAGSSYIQKVSSQGDLLWGSEGTKLNP